MNGKGREALCPHLKNWSVGVLEQWSNGKTQHFNTDDLAKSPLVPFRSWFDTSPRPENQKDTIYITRSP